MPPYVANQDRNLAFIDSETTGLTPGYHEAIEWACVLTKPDGITILDEFEVKVKPRYPERFDARAKEVNGYTEEAWAEAPPPGFAIENLLSLTQGAILVGQNVSFDENFLVAFASAYELKTTHHYHKIDTMNLAWPLIKSGKIDGLSLTNLARWAGVEQEMPHRAMNDVKCVMAVYAALMTTYANL
jgi:DNA polymerase III alpha subunit (gram-positive type)